MYNFYDPKPEATEPLMENIPTKIIVKIPNNCKFPLKQEARAGH